MQQTFQIKNVSPAHKITCLCKRNGTSNATKVTIEAPFSKLMRQNKNRYTRIKSLCNRCYRRNRIKVQISDELLFSANNIHTFLRFLQTLTTKVIHRIVHAFILRLLYKRRINSIRGLASTHRSDSIQTAGMITKQRSKLYNNCELACVAMPFAYFLLLIDNVCHSSSY